MQKWNKRLALVMACLLVIAGIIALFGQKAAEMPVGDQGLRITEICAKNDSLIADSLGRTPDYIELYNPGDALDVTGFVFSNGEVRSAPLAGVIPAGAYRVFFLRETDGRKLFYSSLMDVTTLRHRKPEAHMQPSKMIDLDR